MSKIDDLIRARNDAEDAYDAVVDAGAAYAVRDAAWGVMVGAARAVVMAKRRSC